MENFIENFQTFLKIIFAQDEFKRAIKVLIDLNILLFVATYVHILFHELGHAFWSWKVGSGVEKISVGAIRLGSFMVGDTEVEFGLLPIQGYMMPRFEPGSYQDRILVSFGGVWAEVVCVFFSALIYGFIANRETMTESGVIAMGVGAILFTTAMILTAYYLAWIVRPLIALSWVVIFAGIAASFLSIEFYLGVTRVFLFTHLIPYEWANEEPELIGRFMKLMVASTITSVLGNIFFPVPGSDGTRMLLEKRESF